MFESFIQKFKNSDDVTECCIVGYKYCIVGFISIYTKWLFFNVKNVLFDFQLA